jgi:hypothetical protein
LRQNGLNSKSEGLWVPHYGRLCGKGGLVHLNILDEENKAEESLLRNKIQGEQSALPDPALLILYCIVIINSIKAKKNLLKKILFTKQ